MPVRVLWISRHRLPKEAINELENLFGNLEIIQENITFPERGKDALRILKDRIQFHRAQVVGGVFPAQLWLEMLKNPPEFPLFVVISKAIPARDGTTREFVFDHLEIYGNLQDK